MFALNIWGIKVIYYNLNPNVSISLWNVQYHETIWKSSFTPKIHLIQNINKTAVVMSFSRWYPILESQQHLSPEPSAGETHSLYLHLPPDIAKYICINVLHKFNNTPEEHKAHNSGTHKLPISQYHILLRYNEHSKTSAHSAVVYKMRCYMSGFLLPQSLLGGISFKTFHSYCLYSSFCPPVLSLNKRCIGARI